jgi:hypothetical protein
MIVNVNVNVEVEVEVLVVWVLGGWVWRYVV